jgi:hypothetical protein
MLRSAAFEILIKQEGSQRSRLGIKNEVVVQSISATIITPQISWGERECDISLLLCVSGLIWESNSPVDITKLNLAGRRCSGRAIFTPENILPASAERIGSAVVVRVPTAIRMVRSYHTGFARSTDGC